ncbi:MAG: DUF5605 domain-containing protein [Roseburia sp.]|nr:DUF5605 domain-containing protein [Roseburia sp.]MCM1098575.1 DUF5605 domain-containing protein [Ruminococcus flavefaciens]
MRQYEMFELSLQGQEPTGSQAVVDLWGEFTRENETETVTGFYAGNGVYKVRFYPRRPGVYRWRVEGAVAGEGQEECLPAREGNHGMVRVDGLHFKHEDGTCYRPVGTTVYALVHQEKALVDTTMETLSKAPFNKVRFCLFPKHYDFNHNEPEYYAFEKKDGEWDVNRPCFAFWDAFEERIRQLDEMGIQGDLILFHPYDRWGFAHLSKEDSLTYLDYLTRRFSAFPNLWWSLANEYDLMDNYTREDWTDFARFLKEHDPYGHLLSNHNCFDYWDFSQPEITHCCIQDITVDEVPELQRKYQKPVIFDECRYEGNIIHPWGSLSAREMVHRFWTAMAYGGYCTHGETYYSDDEILWWARGGVLKGESPARIAFLREIMESLPGPLEFLPEGAGKITAEMIAELKKTGLPEEMRNNFFLRGLIPMPEERVLPFLLRERPCVSHCGEEVYLRYYGKECTALGELNLPEGGSYRIEVIDTWEMTREVVREGAGGRVQVKLPGKEGIAVLATAER